ncbi:MAG: alcohol dehydrogenase catalytic domain-containing protein [Candidatus Eisenbacteria bacterium]
MQALRFRDGTARLEEVPMPVPQPGEALIAVARAGICATDIEITRGYMGFEGTLGHEFVGRIVDIATSRTDLPGSNVASQRGERRDAGLGDSPGDRPREPLGVAVGDRVVGEINLPCRVCETCRAGRGNHCPDRTVLGILGKDGVFASHVTLPIANLHRVADEIDDRRAAFVEPLAAALQIQQQVAIDRNARVLVIGDGRLGLLCALTLVRVAGAVHLIGHHARKLRIASDAGVRTHLRSTESPDSNRPSQAPGAVTAGGSEVGDVPGSFDVVVEATGSPAGWDLAVSSVRPRGTVVLKTTTHAARPWNPAPLVIDEITVVGSRCGPFGGALEWLSRGWIDPLPLLEEEAPFSDAEAALHRAGEGRLKVQLVME